MPAVAVSHTKRAVGSAKKATIIAAATKPAHRINDRAMLVCLSVHRWTTTTVDRKATDEVAKAHNIKGHAGQYHKELIERNAFNEINSLCNQLRAEHWFRTLPWIDGGVRVLSSAGYFEYNKAITTLREQYMVAVNTFLDKFEDHRDAAQARLGTLFNAAEYPTRKDLESRYGVTLRVLPIPDQEDFRVDLGAEETKRVRESIESQMKDVMDQAMQDVWIRLRDVVEKASARLKEGGIFRDTLVTNITDLLNILPTLNITGDPKLNEFAKAIRAQVTVATPEVLRDDEKVRSTVAAAADDILAKMSMFIS